MDCSLEKFSVKGDVSAEAERLREVLGIVDLF
jgi:hypothetical protein